jgi:hypothetical protein
MTSAATAAGRFVRRTSLGDDEYRVNFKQIDCEVLKALTSDEACAVTPSMSKIYCRLLLAPSSCWEREGVLRFVGEEREGETLTAWEQLIELTGVANSTLSKALRWMHGTGVIGYHPRKNGVGIRIFINRASSSIRRRGQKNLRLVSTPSDRSPAPPDETPFNEGKSRIDLDKDITPRAHPRAVIAPLFNSSSHTDAQAPVTKRKAHHSNVAPLTQIDIGQVVGMVKIELKSAFASICDDAIASACRNAAAMNREWFEKAAIPKAVRVAQSEAFNVLRSHGVIPKHHQNSAKVGSNHVASKGDEGVGSEASNIAAFLAEALDAIRRVADDDALSEKNAIRAAFSEVEKDLSDLRSRIILSDGRMPVDPVDIENKLAAAEDVILRALWRATDPEELERMSKAASVKLQRYKRTMEPAMYEDTLRRCVVAGLRERFGIPHLSLFYLAPAPPQH